jgi:hypothetical protein
MGINLTYEEKERVVHALQMWKNVIETGTHLLSARDVERMGPYAKVKVHALDSYQMKLILNLDEIIEKVQKR